MPLAIRKDEWARIARWADHDKEDPETVRRRQYVQYLTDASNTMTKDWPNSLENVNKRNEEVRRARREAAEAANTTFYQRYVKKKQDEQRRLMHSARDTVFKNKDAPKLLLSAVIETVVQKEREEQLKFKKEQRRLETEQKRQNDADIVRNAREWHDLVSLKNKRRFEANKKYQKEILEQAHEIAERNRIEYESELNLQKIDNMKADEEMDAIKQFEDEFKAAEKTRIWRDMEQARAENSARRRQHAATDQLDDRLIGVLLRSRARIQRRRLATEKELREEKLRILEKISQKLESGDANREAKEQAILDKAIKEKEAIALARRQADEARTAAHRRSRAASRAQFLSEQARRDDHQRTTQQWDIMNRFKNEELYEEYKDNLREEKDRKVKEYREDILKLWKERDDREAYERAQTRHFYGPLAEHARRQADCRVLLHARQLLEEACDKQRPPRPLLRAVQRYCKMNRLYPMPELPTSQQEHFQQYAPRDESQPDATCDLPPPPEPTPPGQKGKRDGIDQKNAFPKCSEKPATSETTDFRRQGRANGLQRRPAQQTELQLPPITVVPCNNDSCQCELKQ